MSTTSKKLFAGIGLGIVLILVFLAGRSTGGSPVHGDHPEVTEATPAAAAETIWTCSMHPQVRQPDPGQCPLCGMDLIPAPADDDADDDSELPRLRVSERSAALMNIQTWPVERRVVEREIRLLGRVNFDETRQRTVTAWIPGRLDRLLVDVEGSRIQKGDAIAEVYSPALISAQEELLQALRAVRNREGGDSPMVSAARERLRLLGLSSEQVEAIEERGAVEDHIVVHSPLSGVITRRIAVEGSFVQAGDPIAELAGLDRVFVDLEAYERDLPWLLNGQQVRFRVEGLGGEEFEETIGQINPFVDPERRTARVRVQVDNPEEILKPGMFARAVAVSSLGDPEGVPRWREEPPLVIPATAALITGRRAVVYVKIRDTDRPTFELRQVNLGPRAGESYIVRDGLSEGELVVTHGNFKIDSELQLRGRPSMMAPEGNGAPVHDHGPHDSPADPRETPERRDFADEVDPVFGEEIAGLIGGYLALTEGLVADDEAEARQGLEDLHERLQEIGQHRLSGEAHLAWMEFYDSLHGLIHRMDAAPDIGGLRDHLQELTHLMEAIYLNFGGDAMPELQRAYCPMALDDQGATWLQTSRNIYNPYYGAAMLRCGVVLSWDGAE